MNNLNNINELYNSINIFNINYAKIMMYNRDEWGIKFENYAIIQEFDAARMTFKEFKEYYNNIIYIYENINNEEILRGYVDINDTLEDFINRHALNIDDLVLYQIDEDDIFEMDFNEYVKEDLDYIINGIKIEYNTIDKLLMLDIYYTLKHLDNNQELQIAYIHNYIDNELDYKNIGGTAGNSERLEHKARNFLFDSFETFNDLLEVLKDTNAQELKRIELN